MRKLKTGDILIAKVNSFMNGSPWILKGKRYKVLGSTCNGWYFKSEHCDRHYFNESDNYFKLRNECLPENIKLL